eukprot:382641-Rhodomonas_salina.2
MKKKSKSEAVDALRCQNLSSHCTFIEKKETLKMRFFLENNWNMVFSSIKPCDRITLVPKNNRQKREEHQSWKRVLPCEKNQKGSHVYCCWSIEDTSEKEKKKKKKRQETDKFAPCCTLTRSPSIYTTWSRTAAICVWIGTRGQYRTSPTKHVGRYIGL